MNWSHSIRQVHRWTSALFTLAVLVNVLLIGRVSEQTGVAVGLATLLPLFLLLLTGLYLFALPWVAGWRARRRSS